MLRQRRADAGSAPAGTVHGEASAERLDTVAQTGQTATGQFQGTASLYQYFAATVVILILVSLLPPNRADSWLRFRP